MTERLAHLGGKMWEVHFEGRRRANAGDPVIELTIGEPDVPVAPDLLDVAEKAMRAGRTRYSVGRGEPEMLNALSDKYTRRTGRKIGTDQILCMPGTQGSLAVAMMSLVEKGDAVLVPDPYYATYEGVVRATNADFVPVPMDASNGFHLTENQLRDAITPNAKVLLLNSPHNPTGAVLSEAEVEAIGRVAVEHNLWIVCDEVYEKLVYDGAFASPLDNEDFADRVIVVSSISKSHAAPGFRSGWCVGPSWFTERVLAISEALFFGGQPFIADMTAYALNNHTQTHELMCTIYQQRIKDIMAVLGEANSVAPVKPESGMFMLLDVSATGLTGEQFARRLLDEKLVSVMPGSSFGAQAENFIRLSLTVESDQLIEAARRIVTLADELANA